MSGRKKSEVVSVIRNANNSRQDIFQNYSKAIENLISSLNSISSAQTDSLTALPNISSECNAYFQDQIQSLKQELEQLANEDKSYKLLFNRNYSDQYNSIKNQLNSLNHNMEELQRRIENKAGDHYFDSEYSQASSFLNEYSSIRNTLSRMQLNLSREVVSMDSVLTNKRAVQNRGEEIIQSISEFEKMAANRKKEEESIAIISESKSLFSQIDLKLANKFLVEEYSHLAKNQSEFESSGTLVISKYKTHFSRISGFIKKLSEKVRKFEEQKKNAHSKIQSINSTLSAITYKDPLNKDKVFPVKEFCEKVLNHPELYSRLETSMREMKSSFDKENFLHSSQIADSLLLEIQSLQSNLDEKSIKFKEQVQTALAIEEVLKEVGYKVKISLKDGKIANGIIIKTDPDTYEMSMTEEKGKTDIQLDHNESSSSCKASVTEIQERLRKRGIGFNVTDWGGAEGKRTKEQSVTSENSREMK